MTVYARTQRFVKANGSRLESFSFFSLDFSKADDLHKRKKTKFFTQHSFPTSLSMRHSRPKFFARIKFITFVKKTTRKSHGIKRRVHIALIVYLDRFFDVYTHIRLCAVSIFLKRTDEKCSLNSIHVSRDIVSNLFRSNLSLQVALHT